MHVLLLGCHGFIYKRYSVYKNSMIIKRNILFQRINKIPIEYSSFISICTCTHIWTK